MNTYLAFLRGINVGGKSLIKMAELREALTSSGLANVRTYIQSGNVIFRSDMSDTGRLASLIGKIILKRFEIDAGVAVFTSEQWRRIVDSAPDWWGRDKSWKHNLLIIIGPHDMDEVISAIGELKPGIEAVKPGEGVVYQSMSFKDFGRTTTGKLASSPLYKRMTVRNYNTAVKLESLLSEM